MKTFQEFLTEDLNSQSSTISILVEGSKEDMEARSKMTSEESAEYSDLQTKYLSKRVKEETARFSNEFRQIFFSIDGKQKIQGYLENKLLVSDLLQGV